MIWEETMCIAIAAVADDDDDVLQLQSLNTRSAHARQQATYLVQHLCWILLLYDCIRCLTSERLVCYTLLLHKFAIYMKPKTNRKQSISVGFSLPDSPVLSQNN